MRPGYVRSRALAWPRPVRANDTRRVATRQARRAPRDGAHLLRKLLCLHPHAQDPARGPRGGAAISVPGSLHVTRIIKPKSLSIVPVLPHVPHHCTCLSVAWPCVVYIYAHNAAPNPPTGRLAMRFCRANARRRCPKLRCRVQHGDTELSERPRGAGLRGAERHVVTHQGHGQGRGLRPSRAKSAPRSVWRALLMSQVNPGSLYRRGKRI